VQLAGVTIAVTGGVSGLGRATAARLTEVGSRVLLVDLPAQTASGQPCSSGRERSLRRLTSLRPTKSVQPSTRRRRWATCARSSTAPPGR
jgi:NAD(P)-dependent dehydrogenase (short-subunit alcohol dehydrogenase family)